MASLSVSRRLKSTVDVEFQTDILARRRIRGRRCVLVFVTTGESHLNTDGIFTGDDARRWSILSPILIAPWTPSITSILPGPKLRTHWILVTIATPLIYSVFKAIDGNRVLHLAELCAVLAVSKAVTGRNQMRFDPTNRAFNRECFSDQLVIDP